MKNINKIIDNIKNREVKSKQQIILDQEKREIEFKAHKKERLKEYIHQLKKYEEELKEIKKLLNIVNKKFYKKYQVNIFNEWSLEDMFSIGNNHILYYSINAPYADWVTLKNGSTVKTEYPFKSCSTIPSPKIELSKKMDYYQIHYISGGPSPFEGEEDPDNKYIRRSSKKEIFEELINLIDYHTLRL